MPETHGFIRVPPDSTGKRVPHSVLVEVEYTAASRPFVVGEEINISAIGLICEVFEIEAHSPTTGELHVRVVEPVPNSITVSSGLSITDSDGVTVATTYSGNPFYIPQAVIAGGSHLTNHLEIDAAGAASVRFTEGSPKFDAFGKMQVSQQHKLADYVFTYNTKDTDFTSVTYTGGSYSHQANMSACLLTCDTQATALVQRTTDTYHFYQPGISQLIEFTAACGDVKEGVTRRSGLYDDENGLYFEIAGNVLNVVIRSKSSGVVLENRISSTAWNGDRLDGTESVYNPSGLNLDPTKDNIFWIDFQWLGAGTVRFGIIHNGVRIVCHSVHHSNVVGYSYMTTPHLPFRFEQFNTQATASTSEFRVFCASVFTEGEFSPLRALQTTNNTVNVPSTTAVPLIGLRAAQTYGNANNRGMTYMHSFSIYNGASVPILLELWRGVTVTDGSWVAHGGDSSTEVNKTLTAFTGGKQRYSVIICPGECENINFEGFENRRKGFQRKADITKSIDICFTAKMISSGTAGDVFFTANWEEVRS